MLPAGAGGVAQQAAHRRDATAGDQQQHRRRGRHMELAEGGIEAEQFARLCMVDQMLADRPPSIALTVIASSRRPSAVGL